MEEDTTISGCETNDAVLSATWDLETVRASNVKHPAQRRVTFSPGQKITGDSAREGAEDAPSLEDIEAIEAIVHSFLDDNELHRSDYSIRGLVLASRDVPRFSVDGAILMLSHHLDGNQDLARELFNRLLSEVPTSVASASATSPSSSLTKSRTRDGGSTTGTVNEAEAEGARVPVQQENTQGVGSSAAGSSSTCTLIGGG